MTAKDAEIAIQKVLEDSERRSLLRLSTAGSVDDGKSTLIGRLLHDTKGLYEDQLDSVRGKSTQSEEGEIDYALITDGLKAEREQGITIDVAYRYFSSPKRHFILADTPGHEQYTRNMATGASTAQLAILLVDARNGISVQTKRHAFISSLLGIPRVVVAVNKMDLVDWKQSVFEDIKEEFIGFAAKLNIHDIQFIPISALQGDNVARRSTEMDWYQGTTVINYLEEVYVDSDRNLVDFRFPVQYVIRPNQDFRGYAGRVAGGTISKGDEVVVLPSKKRSRVKAIHTYDGEIDEAFAPMSVTLTLEHEIDISRGDMIVRSGNVPHLGQRFESILIWMSDQPLDPKRPLRIKHGPQECQVRIEDLRYRIDVNNLSRIDAETLDLNEIGRARLRTAKPLFLDPYQKCKSTGSFILVDPISNVTLAAGIVIDRTSVEQLPAIGDPDGPEPERKEASKNIFQDKEEVSLVERESRLGHRGVTVWMTGLSGSGKSAIGRALERRLFDEGMYAYRLDGDNLRFGLNSDLGFSAMDRSENIRRVAEVARLFNRGGSVAICTFISPFEADRALARGIIGEDRFVEVHVSTPLEVCEQRDVKGLYQKARSGDIRNFTGISSPYEEPEAPEARIDTSDISTDEAVEQVMQALKGKLKP